MHQLCQVACPAFLATINVFKVSNKNTRKWCEICSKLTIKTSEQRQRRGSGQ